MLIITALMTLIDPLSEWFRRRFQFWGIYKVGNNFHCFATLVYAATPFDVECLCFLLEVEMFILYVLTFCYEIFTFLYFVTLSG